METMAKYALITPARNEDKYIEGTIRSVVAQEVKPLKWIIVSDGSTDKTDEIAESYARRNSFIELLTAKNAGKRNFGSKVNAFNIGYEKLRTGGIPYDFIGNLDADVTFEKTYYREVIKTFNENRRLGLAGGIIEELINQKYVAQSISMNSVAGAVQFFRRKCFEQIGGYIPLNIGGIDAAAEIMARMHGWEVRTFPALKVLHHRRVAKGGGAMLKARFRQGQMYYNLGYHPLFQIIRCAPKLTDSPVFTGSLSMMAGFLWCYIKSKERELPNQVISFLRKEQKQRIRDLLRIG
jgi:biofilm PGA synthesis N-glycosyltransferase PgaC